MDPQAIPNDLLQTSKSHVSRRILITGIAGAIGRCIAPVLAARGHSIRGLDQKALPGFDCVVGDIADASTVRSAVDGVDAIIHLAAYPDPADFHTVLLGPNVVGMMNICQAAAEAHVPRLVLASSVQVLGGHRGLARQRPICVADGTAPINFYALTKVWAEETGRMFAHNHPDLTVLVARIGWFARTTVEKQRIADRNATATYLSHQDACRFFTACIENPLALPAIERFAILFAYSKAGRQIVDLADTQNLIGYQPQDVFPEGSTFPAA